MKDMIVKNVEKIIPVIQEEFTKAGNQLGDILNDCIDRTIDKIFSIISNTD